MLDHEKLDAYQRAIEFVALAYAITSNIPRGNAAIADQFRRAATSIPLNIAEGAGKTSRRDRSHYYGIARGSAMECGAILDVLFLLGHCPEAQREPAKALLVRVVSMLSRMCR